MNIETYAIEAAVEQTHWWFYVRRNLFESLIREMNLSQTASILDVGTSSGTNLRMLKAMNFKSYQGLDISIESQRYCKEKEIGEVIIGDVQSDPLGENQYDLILATDVLEHLNTDHDALSNIYRSLQPGGYFLITVPCFPFLWGPQDIVAQHKRRYKKTDLLNKLSSTHFNIQRVFYFNFFLFVPIFLARRWLLWKNKIVNENTINNSMINTIMKSIFSLDCWLAKHIPFPFGVSLCVIAKKPETKQ